MSSKIMKTSEYIWGMVGRGGRELKGEEIKSVRAGEFEFSEFKRGGIGSNQVEQGRG